jgi:hypothetical protein
MVNINDQMKIKEQLSKIEGVVKGFDNELESIRKERDEEIKKILANQKE